MIIFRLPDVNVLQFSAIVSRNPGCIDACRDSMGDGFRNLHLVRPVNTPG